MSDFVFFHGYDSKLWDCFVKRGIINSNAGIRFCQNLMLPEEKKFNRLMKDDKKLKSLVHDERLPVYIDRLQGGAYIDTCRYDMELIEALEDRFYGFQMHEWMSNLRTDYNKLSRVKDEEWNKETIEKEIFRQFPFKHLFLEAATAEEFAIELKRPKTFEELLINAEKLYRKRLNETGGRLIPCDSAMMAANLEFKLGAKRVMPEIGAQTPLANIQLSYARGMAKAYKGSFGAYYEPWGGKPFSVCTYFKDGINEWNIKSEGDFPFKALGGEGGSSRSLQRRIYIYSYLAGASFLSEEWGLHNTFIDDENFELSPYGLVKKEFLSFISKYDQGKFYAPIAIVLPKDMMALANVYNSSFNQSLEMPYENKGTQERDKKIAEKIRELMGQSASGFGNEYRTLPNSNIPDAFDIIHEDCESVLGEYEYLVDLSFNPAFKKKHGNIMSPKEAVEKISELMPCRVSGGLHWFVNRLKNGWYLTVFNNDGIEKSVEYGEKANPEAERTAKVELKSGLNLLPLEGSKEIKRIDGKFFVTLKGGDIFFAKLV